MPLTIFTILKPMEQPTSQDWKNQDMALWSWQQMNPKPNIIVFGKPSGVTRWLKSKHPEVRHIPELATSDDGLGRVDSAFTQILAEAETDLVMFCNGDIILPPWTPEVVDFAGQQFSKFLMTGRRINMPRPVEFKRHDGWWDWAFSKASRLGHPGGPHGMDYFAFRRGTLFDLPPMYVGRWFWDTAMVKLAIDHDIPLIDASEAMPIIHQFHDYRHAGGLRRLSTDRYSTENATHIDGAQSYRWNTDDTDYQLDRLAMDTFKLQAKPPSPQRVLRGLF